MSITKNAYISIGSNKGDKFKNLQDAINLICQNIGDVKAISKVYKSPAFGFESDDFLNACISVNTTMAAEQLLVELLAIEKQLGRTRSGVAGYEARIIDLDIIFYEDNVIETNTLKVPHPEMHKRKFVLKPLNDIASKMIHPVLKKDCNTLLQECKDTSLLEPINILLERLH